MSLDRLKNGCSGYWVSRAVDHTNTMEKQKLSSPNQTRDPM